jgi:hypothetical protein
MLHAEDESSLIFCWNCGAAQVTLSEELQEQAAEQLRLAEAGPENAGRPAVAPLADSSEIVWRSLLMISLGIAAALSVFDLLLPMVALLAPVIVLAIYGARFRQSPITAGLGARVGIVCGLFTAVCISTLLASGMLISRATTHRMSPLGNSVIERAREQAVAKQGPAAAAVLDEFRIPEVRVGWFLSFAAIGLVFWLLFSAAGGAFAGYVRSQSRARSGRL